MGDVLECHTTGTNVQMNHKQGSDEVACDAHSGKTIELKVGTTMDQHMVAIDPGQGLELRPGLCYVRANLKAAQSEAVRHPERACPCPFSIFPSNPASRRAARAVP